MTVRVGFLGAGLIATYHSKSLRRSGGRCRAGRRVRSRPRPGRGVRCGERAHRRRLRGRGDRRRRRGVHLHVDERASSPVGQGRRGRSPRLLREATGHHAGRRTTDGRPRPGRRHRQPGRAGPAPLAGVPARQAPRRRSRRRTADGRGDARRPVHPGAGPLRQHLAGRPRPRRRRHAARAQHPRHRHADVPRRADRAGQCAHHQLPRPRRDRGRRLGDDAVLRRRARRR